MELGLQKRKQPNQGAQGAGQTALRDVSGKLHAVAGLGNNSVINKNITFTELVEI